MTIYGQLLHVNGRTAYCNAHVNGVVIPITIPSDLVINMSPGDWFKGQLNHTIEDITPVPPPQIIFQE